ncbi:MAG TPA: hypothetical protein IGS52_07670 [Oscillatoriaceae cyanobacterium M33_DOE_052]|uniref:Uncharacterized protein n=1 Tax=Planktothricoides sp. SpSt-374 TaxID=2282167 RepID=A0A7C3VFK1_9CYAN|nr:hypothetical protein [Oscillatoriaceae cyanobacterium M33_DOE_052]
MANIIIQVDEEIKAAFDRANPEIKKQLNDMIELLLRDKLSGKTLTEVMAEISDKAQERGLTPEILQEILDTIITED